MYSNKLYTPLRYPGGKGRFAPWITEIIRFNNLEGGHYLEPYAGGAGIALELLYHGIVSDIHINDIDSAVYDFWYAATRLTKDLIYMVATEPITIEAWHHWRSVMRGDLASDALQRGFATLFLNRTNRSGILNAGVIGGKAQSGCYKLDARYKRDVLIARLERLAYHAKNIHIYSEDAVKLLCRCSDFLPKHSLIYLDPPYYVKGQRLYRNFYTHKDHLEIAQLLQDSKFHYNWVISYDDVIEIQSMYEQAQRLNYSLRYTAQRQYTGAEVIFLSENLAVSTKNISKLL